MKIKMAMLIVLVLGGWQLLHADLGNPDLQALCRITLKDGTIVEGAVLAAQGGYQRYWDVNGFYITENPVRIDSDFKLPVFFDFEFLSLEPWTGRTTFARGASGGFNYQGRKPVVYFLEDITFQKLYIDDTKVAERIVPEDSGPAIVLHRTITTTYLYRLLDSIPVFTEIPDEVYLKEGAHTWVSEMFKPAPIKLKHVPIREIHKFELLHKPPQAWLDAIARKTKRLMEALAKCEECEYLLPVWYHEVVKAPEEYHRLFKPWES